MKPYISKAIIENCKKRGYVLVNDVFYPPNSIEAKEFVSSACSNTKKNKSVLNRLKSGWIDDSRNLKNKSAYRDTFDMLVMKSLNLEIWPEFYFSTERAYRLDKVIPVDAAGNSVKIGIEIQGGIWLRGKSGHSSGTGIKRDMDKSNLAISLGWTIIKVEPWQIQEPHWGQTIELIRKAIESKIGNSI